MHIIRFMKIAIDFGTTHVSAAYLLKSGEPYVFTLEYPRHSIPSSVYLQQDGSLLFGSAADSEATKAAANPLNYMRSFKMQLGSDILLLGQYTADQLVTEFFRHLVEKLRADASMRKTNIEEALITCPVTFTPVQRQMLTQAAGAAGIPHVELITEPEAAGVAFCHYCPESAFRERALVLDWGGGTLDIALVSRSERFRISDLRYTAGDQTIGGEVFDDHLAKHILSQLSPAVDARSFPWIDIMNRVSELKLKLSEAESGVFSIYAQGNQITQEVNRSIFEKLIYKDVAKAADLVKGLLDGLAEHEKPEMLVLVGGTALIPCIRQELEKATGLPTHTWMEAREAVVKGAALLTCPVPPHSPQVHHSRGSWISQAWLFGVLAILLIWFFISGNLNVLYVAWGWFVIFPICRMMFHKKWLRLLSFAPIHFLCSSIITVLLLQYYPSVVNVSDLWLRNAIMSNDAQQDSIIELTNQRIVDGEFDEELLNELIQYGYNLNAIPHNGSLLYRAAEKGNHKVVEQLCSRGADVHAGNNTETPLHVASRNGHEECVKLLVSYGANTEIQSPRTPYVEAKTHGHSNISNFLELYSEAGKRRFMEAEKELDVPYLCKAIESDDIMDFRLCLFRGASINSARKSDGSTALHLAMQRNNPDYAFILLNQRQIEVNKRNDAGATALAFAAANDRSQYIDWLLSINADVTLADNSGYTPLIIAAMNGHAEAVEKLLYSSGTAVNHQNNDGNTALHMAARNGLECVVQLLLQNVLTDTTIRNNNGATALTLAAVEGHTNIIRLLLEEKNLNIQNEQQALYNASYYGQAEAVKQLLDAELFNVNQADERGDTPLAVAVMHGHVDTVRILLKASNIDVNKANAEGDTPLIWSVRPLLGQPSEELIKMLLATPGIDVNKQNNSGETALEIAEIQNLTNCAELLRAAGSNK